MKGRRVASIDIGSNAMRLLIAEDRNGKLEAVESDRASVRLGGEVFAQGEISDQTIARAVEALKEFKEKIDKAAVTHYRAIGTSAMRDAKNSQVLIAQAKKEAGVDLEIIDGEEEARLVYLAVSETVVFSKGIDLLVDIGGGSVEITIVRAGSIVFSESFKMGTVRLMRLFDSDKVSAKQFKHLVSEYTQGIKAKIREQIGSQVVERCIGTGGNLETFLKLKQHFFGKKGSQIERAELAEILEELQELSLEERIDKLGLRADRADVVVPAAIVMLHVLAAAAATTLLVPGVGVKEGVAYELLRDVRENDPHFCRANLRDAALVIGRKYHFIEPHAVWVAKLSLDIFDQTTSLHGLDEEGRKLLELAALLHDIGHYVSAQGHHKHSFYLIEACSFPSLTKHEKLMVGCIARYHRKKFPEVGHPGYSELKTEDRLVVSQLASILRLADGLDRDHSQHVKSLSLELKPESTPKVATLFLEGQGDLSLDRWSVKLKSDLFEHVYGIPIEIGARSYS